MLRTMTTHLKTSARALALCLPLLASAQPSDGGTPPSPVPETQQLRYQSAFTDYKPWLYIEPADWRAVNDAVGGTAPAIGSHAGHGAAATPVASPPATSTSPVHRQSGAHHSHGGAK